MVRIYHDILKLVVNIILLVIWVHADIFAYIYVKLTDKLKIIILIYTVFLFK